MSLHRAIPLEGPDDVCVFNEVVSISFFWTPVRKVAHPVTTLIRMNGPVRRRELCKTL
jgi:hypothetical protein